MPLAAALRSAMVLLLCCCGWFVVVSASGSIEFRLRDGYEKLLFGLEEGLEGTSPYAFVGGGAMFSCSGYLCAGDR